MKRLILILAVVGCGTSCGGVHDGAGRGEDAGREDAGPNDAARSAVEDASRPDSSISESCSDLVVGVDLVRATSVSDEIVRTFRDRGFRGTSAKESIANIYVRDIRAPLTGADPGQAALDLITSIAPDVLHADQLGIDETYDWSASDGQHVLVYRKSENLETRFWRPALSLFVLNESSVWTLQSFVVYVPELLTDASTVARLAACTRDETPSETGVRMNTFDGLLMRDCGPSGTYSYTPQSGDSVTWQASMGHPSAVTWESSVSDANLVWRVVRPAILEIAPENYFERINEADCYCPALTGETRAGFEILVDINTGEVIDSSPAIQCVVC